MTVDVFTDDNTVSIPTQVPTQDVMRVLTEPDQGSLERQASMIKAIMSGMILPTK